MLTPPATLQCLMDTQHPNASANTNANTSTNTNTGKHGKEGMRDGARRTGELGTESI